MFKEKKYTVIKKAISYELANFAYNYLLLKREAVKFMLNRNYISKFTPGFGWWEHSKQQVPDTYACYSDFFMETLMMKVLPIMQQRTEMNLIPTYSYTRIYKKGDILKRHSDRHSCEISTTLHLGGDPWTLFLDPTGQKTVIDEEKQTYACQGPGPYPDCSQLDVSAKKSWDEFTPKVFKNFVKRNLINGANLIGNQEKSTNWSGNYLFYSTPSSISP